MSSRKKTHSYLKKARNKMFWNGKWRTKHKKVFADGSTDKWTQMKETKKKKSEQKSKVNQERKKAPWTEKLYLWSVIQKGGSANLLPSIINRWISNIFRHCEIGLFSLSQHFNNEHIIVFSFVFCFSFGLVVCGSAQSAAILCTF